MRESPKKDPKKLHKPAPQKAVRAKKEKPEDPIIARAREGGAILEAPALPELRITEALREEAVALNSAIRRLDYLDLQIWRLNQHKSRLYGELARQGIDRDTIRRAMKDRKLDDVKRAERDIKYSVYWQLIERKPAESDAPDDVPALRAAE